MAKAAKYRNKPTIVDGHRFDSQAEARRYVALKALVASGVITDLRLQVPFVLAPGVRIAGAKRKGPPLRYLADFVYRDNCGAEIVNDVKGKLTQAYVIKRHLMKSVHGIDILET